MVGSAPVEQQIEAWAGSYLSPWTELPRVQLDDYASLDLGWRETAEERIFPQLDARMEELKSAHKNQVRSLEPIYYKSLATLGFKSEVFLSSMSVSAVELVG